MFSKGTYEKRLLYFCSGARDQNLTWVTRNKTLMDIKGVTRSSGASCPSHIQYMCFTEKQNKTKKQVHKTQQLKLQNSIHPKAVGGRKGKWKGNGTGRKSIPISPGTGLANARKELQKNLWSFQTHQCLKSILVAGRFCLTCTRDKNLDSSERRECGQGPWQGGPCLPWEGVEVNQRRAATASLPSHLAPLDGGWPTQRPAAAFTLAGDGCGEGNFSAEVELLRADCR